MRSPVAVGDVDDATADCEHIRQSLDALTPAGWAAMTAAIEQYEQAIGDVTWQP